MRTLAVLIILLPAVFFCPPLQAYDPLDPRFHESEPADTTSPDTAAPAPKSRFAGRLYITADKNGTFPVYLDGEYQGKTPLELAGFPVGRYTISFLKPSERKTLEKVLRTGEVAAYHIPESIASHFPVSDGRKPFLLRSLDQYSRQVVVVKNGQTTHARFYIDEIQRQMKSQQFSFIWKAVLGSSISVGVLALIFVQFL